MTNKRLCVYTYIYIYVCVNGRPGQRNQHQHDRSKWANATYMKANVSLQIKINVDTHIHIIRAMIKHNVLIFCWFNIYEENKIPREARVLNIPRVLHKQQVEQHES